MNQYDMSDIEECPPTLRYKEDDVEPPTLRMPQRGQAPESVREILTDTDILPE